MELNQTLTHKKTDRQTFITRNAEFAIKPIFGGASGESKVQSIGTLTGYAMKWGDLSDDRGGYKVRLLPNSANFTTPTMALFHHDFARIIGNTENGTLRTFQDSTGVKVEIDLPDSSHGRDTLALVRDGYVSGMSFAMVEKPTFTMVKENDQNIMNVSSFLCDECTITCVPSFTNTSIEVAPEPAQQMAKRDMQALRAIRSKINNIEINLHTLPE